MLKDNYTKYRTDKFSTHSYLGIYGQLFDPRKDSVKNCLEVGIQRGGSMILWSDLFPQAHIYGADIIPLPNDFVLTDRMTHLVGDAYDVNFIKKHFGEMKFDVLVDDGPHTLPSMLFFAQHYSKLLAPKGALVIEDIQSPAWIHQIINSLPSELRSKAKFIDNKSAVSPVVGKPVGDDIILYIDLKE